MSLLDRARIDPTFLTLSTTMTKKVACPYRKPTSEIKPEKTRSSLRSSLMPCETMKAMIRTAGLLREPAIATTIGKHCQMLEPTDLQAWRAIDTSTQSLALYSIESSSKMP
jgi:hypothetical protein